MEENITVCLSSFILGKMKRTLLSLMLLVLAAVKMKDLETDRHKRAFWDLLQLQEAASPSKFATWQWWSACLIRWCVSPQVCTPRRTRKHNWECVQRLEGCLTTSLVCLCLCVLRLLSSLSCLFHPLPRSLSVCLSWRESWGNRWKSIRREQTSYIPSVMFREAVQCAGVEIRTATGWQWGKRR